MVLINPQIDGVLRHLITFGMGFLVSGGYIPVESVEGLVAAVVTVAALVWSIVSKTKPAA